MTPLEIEIVMHYYCCPGEYREGDFTAPAVRSIIDEFRDQLGLIKQTPDGYKITDKGAAFVQSLCSVQLPVQVWVSPEKAKELTLHRDCYV